MNDVLRIVTIFQSINNHHADKVISVRISLYTNLNFLSTQPVYTLASHCQQFFEKVLGTLPLHPAKLYRHHLCTMDQPLRLGGP